MGGYVGRRLVSAIAFASAGFAVTAQAQASAGSEPPSASEEVAAMVAFSLERNSAKAMAADLDVGGIALRGRVERTGRRRNCEQYFCGEWQRAYVGEAEAWLHATDTAVVHLQYRLSHEKRSNAQAPLLTDRTSGLSHNFVLELREDEAAMSLIAFDRAGWSDSNLADFAERVNNAEHRVQRGVTLEYAFTESFAQAETRTSFAFTHASTLDGVAETAAIVRFQARF